VTAKIFATATIGVAIFLFMGCGESQHQKEMSEALATIHEVAPMVKNTKHSLDVIKELDREGNECSTVACVRQITSAIKARTRIIQTEGRKIGAILKSAKSPKVMQEALKQYANETGIDLQAELEEIYYRVKAHPGF
jgi:hypothetical protein